MTFDSQPYELKLLTRKVSDETLKYEYCYLYSFRSPKTNLDYLLTAEYYREHEIFMIKFCKRKDKGNKNRYRILTATETPDVYKIVVTCASVIPILLKKYPRASFGLLASNTIAGDKAEPLLVNQRFRIYIRAARVKIRNLTFAHFAYPRTGGYLLVNRCHEDVHHKESEIKQFLSEILPEISEE